MSPEPPLLIFNSWRDIPDMSHLDSNSRPISISGAYSETNAPHESLRVSSTDARHDRRRTRVAIVSAIFVICLFDFRLFRYLHLDQIYSILDIPRQIYEGTPHWRAFQNRVLVPYAVAGVVKAFHVRPREAALLVYFLLTFVGNVVAYRFLKSLRPSNPGQEVLRDLVVFNFLIFGISHNWFYPWDFGEIILPCLLLMMVRQPEMSVLKFAALFVVWILNRETGILLGAWLVVDAIVRPYQKWKKLIMGVVMMTVGLLVVYELRTILFKESSLPGVGLDLETRVLGGNHFCLPLNADYLLKMELYSKEVFNVLILLALGAFAWAFRRGIRKDLSVFALMLLMFASDVTFGGIQEMRVFYHLIPFVFFFAYGGGRRTPAEIGRATGQR